MKLPLLPSVWRRDSATPRACGTGAGTRIYSMSSEPSPGFIALQAVLAGRYALERELGRGGMGVVYLARDISLDRPVAIKLLPPTLAAIASFRERFLREARTAARLSHPHIVPIHAVEAHPEFALFVMGYIEGETLSQRIERQGPSSSSNCRPSCGRASPRCPKCWSGWRLRPRGCARARNPVLVSG